MTNEREYELDVMGQRFEISVEKGSFSEGDRVLLVVRPESVALEPKKPNTLIGVVREAVYLGSEMVYEIEVAQSLLTVQIANPQEHIAFKEGDEVTITFQERSLHILPYEEAQ